MKANRPASAPPMTLRQFAGAPTRSAPLSESVVLVVDAQKEYTEGALPLVGIGPSIEALAQFLSRARNAGAPVIHIVQIGRPGGKIFAPRGPFVEIIDAVKPVAGEAVVHKRFPSAFTLTSLETELSNTGRNDLIVTGYMTHMCLNSTVRAAAEAGYRCTVPAELTATRDLPDGQGGILPAATVKAVHLAALADRFAIVVDKGQDIP